MTQTETQTRQLAEGLNLTVVPGEKYRRCIISASFVLKGDRTTATDYAILPHVLERRCAAYPDPLALSRRLFDLYGADIQGESQTAGANRLLTFSVSGLKGEYALYGEDLAAEYARLLHSLVFYPVLEEGCFAAEDVEIEKQKQADFLKSEMNEKAAYCARQARRRLYGDSPAGIESAGYLQDIPGVTPQSLAAAWRAMLEKAHVEILVCGMDGAKAEEFSAEFAALPRTPGGILPPSPALWQGETARAGESMDTAQCKVSMIATSGHIEDAHGDAVMRLASALYGGLPTSRLFMNVREKQSLCYYCSSSYGGFSGTLAINCGVEHGNEERAIAAILAELGAMQENPVEKEELAAAVKMLAGAYRASADSPDSLLSWTFNETLRGTGRTIDDMLAELATVTPEEVCRALAGFRLSVQYTLTATGKGAAS